ncbi:MAG: hypothetical protein BWZ10_01924 [candidate division BRC1 bacterium ADurb.BinA364]|nr:MAG: hypothetical protein BWZ10_01924 [candidate division BRC1 bacterium ADurb.BinA364]
MARSLRPSPSKSLPPATAKPYCETNDSPTVFTPLAASIKLSAKSFAPLLGATGP